MTQASIPENPAAIFISHGGGPLPVLGDAGHVEMVDHLRDIAASIEKPAAIVVVSAHWEQPVATVTAHPRPPLIYDYYGFPPESYTIEYPAPGEPALAERIAAALSAAKIPARLDRARGFDHGLFIPLLIMYPDADVPCVQLSLTGDLDPANHIRIGGALAGLAQDGVLVLGSGFSFHNLKELLGARAGRAPDPENEAFEKWLFETCMSPTMDESERTRRLVGWAGAPGARHCHPREEHLMPLHVCYGVTKQPAAAHAELTIMGKRCSTWFWR